LGRIGNTFRPVDIDRAISKKYDPDNINRYASKSMGIDPAWGSSAFGIVVTQLVNDVVQVLYAAQWLIRIRKWLSCMSFIMVL
jgi:hypothetical protein